MERLNFVATLKLANNFGNKKYFMGGIGSGRFWRYDAKDRVEDNRSIDVRRWQRDGSLYTGNGFNWQWSRDGKPVANINVKVNEGRVILDYRIQRNGGNERPGHALVAWLNDLTRSRA